MKWTTTIPTNPGYYLTHIRFSDGQEICRLLLIYECPRSKQMKVDISHFGSGRSRTLSLTTFTREHENCINACSLFCKVDLPKHEE